MAQVIKEQTGIVKEMFEFFLPDYWNRSGMNEQVLNGYSAELSVLSKNISVMYDQLSIDTATGQSLDEFGFLFRFPRQPGEPDSRYRARLKAYYQIFLNGGTNIGIQKAIALLTDLDESDITVEEVREFKNQLFVANMEPGETWTGTGVDVNTSIFYEGTQSLELSVYGAGVATADLSRNLNLKLNLNTNIESFRFWYYFDDITKITEVVLSFTDGTETASKTIDVSEFLTSYGLFVVDKDDFTDTSEIDWSAITGVQISIVANAATVACFDWIEFGVLANTLKFDINVAVDDSLDIDLLNLISTVANIAKAAGTYYRELTFTSFNNYFLLGLSSANGEDKI